MGRGVLPSATTPVSRQSRFGDPVWHLDIDVAGRRRDQKRIDWSAVMPDGRPLTDPAHAALLAAARGFLWSLAVDPPRGRKRASQSTIHARGQLLIVILRWMVGAGYRTFRSLTPEAVERFRGWLRTRPGRRGTLAPRTVGGYLQIIHDLYRQREKLPDALTSDPFPVESAPMAAGVTRASQEAIPFIPDALAVDILSKALTWVEEHAEAILAARAIWEAAHIEERELGTKRRTVRRHAQRVLRQTALCDPDGAPICDGTAARRLGTRLTDACFIVIAGFVGMRVGEILSLRAGAIELHVDGDRDLPQAYVRGRLFKTVDDLGGRVERWLAPAPVVRAVEVLERLGEPLRRVSGRDELFLIRNSQYGEIVPLSAMHIAFRLREFAAHVGVPEHEGKLWPFAPHQFRKTFARFVARRDRSQLLGLAEHFKHASVALTARGYVGTDFDLQGLVDHEGQVETAAALDRFLASDRLAGKMGERIVASNAMFRGRAGEQVRRDYIGFVLQETDLRVHACDYGWCVFQPETARCGGTLAPGEAGRAPAVCVDCANFVVDGRHRAYWEDRRRRNADLREAASPLRRAVFDEAVEQCDRVLIRLGTEDGDDRQS